MSRRSVLPSLVPGVPGVLAVLAVLAGSSALPGLERAARANGRLPATASITFRQGHERDIVAGLTFGMAISHDGGATWAWMCDDALGIAGGPYDPIYAYTPAGTLFATTLGGLIAMRDGCTFDPAPSGKTFVSAHTLGPDGAFYYGAAQTAMKGTPSDFQIYKSTDDGVTFPVHPQPDPPTDVNVWWQSIMVAPSKPTTVYLSGYRYLPNQSGNGTTRDHLLFRSDDGGTSWAPQTPPPPSLNGLTLAQNSVIHIVGVASDDPKHVYARVEYIDDKLTDGLYVSTNAGASWTQIHTQPDRFIAFVVRAGLNSNSKHDLLAVTTKFGTEISHDDGANWEPLAGAPHISCLTENAAGELWACTQNYGVGQAQSDDAGIMKSTDLSAWTKVLRYQDLTGPVSACGAATVQQKTCNQAVLWCGVCAQLGCIPSASYVCPSAVSEAPTPAKAGCCDTGASGGGPLALALSVATFVWRPRRRRHPPMLPR